MRRLIFAVAGWLLAATVAVVVGLLAVSLLGTGITGEQVRPLSSEDVARALAQVARESSSPSTQPPAGSTAVTNSPVPSPAVPPSVVPNPPAPSPSTTSTGQVTRALHSAGGNVIAQCTGTMVYLVSWTPRQGFETDDVIRGPAPAAFVKFDSENLDVFLTINCRDGAPVLVEAGEVDD